jgi:chaperonin GroEL
MSAKQIRLHDSARLKIAAGMNILADAVGVTLGPRGRNVIIEQAYRSPLVANSGVVVAREIELKDKLENIGAKMLKQAASKTSEVAGVGTTTATILARAMVEEGMKYVAVGMNPMDLKRGIDKAVDAAVEALRQLSRPCTTGKEIAQVGALSANGDRAVGEIIAQAVEKVGLEGVILVGEGRSLENELEVVEGMQFDRGYLSPYFISEPDRQTALLEEPYVLIYEKSYPMPVSSCSSSTASARKGSLCWSSPRMWKAMRRQPGCHPETHRPDPSPGW